MPEPTPGTCPNPDLISCGCSQAAESSVGAVPRWLRLVISVGLVLFGINQAISLIALLVHFVRFLRGEDKKEEKRKRLVAVMEKAALELKLLGPEDEDSDA
ncbi:Uu.00g097320.m01.CDS01 [Anthostomella pinea]|uniref:Uu.00g097320.m01.CDS01 n=1 Tax=Anthostomella pinea TaxID=933095 RepID=A0AAI8YF58_9PEZI|nr:Uu.00g097320.m01.CDS01 [Anthostomella pinea]